MSSALYRWHKNKAQSASFIPPIIVKIRNQSNTRSCGRKVEEGCWMVSISRFQWLWSFQFIINSINKKTETSKQTFQIGHQTGTRFSVISAYYQIPEPTQVSLPFSPHRQDGNTLVAVRYCFPTSKYTQTFFLHATIVLEQKLVRRRSSFGENAH